LGVDVELVLALFLRLNKSSMSNGCDDLCDNSCDDMLDF